MGALGEDLEQVGTGPTFRAFDWTMTAEATRRQILELGAGDGVEVLLDDGRIVRSTVRHAAVERPWHTLIWIDGITGGYSAARCRPAGWRWWGRLA